MGSSSYALNHSGNGSSPNMNNKGFKPLDNLLISDKIRMLEAKSSTKRAFQAYPASFCKYQEERNKGKQ